MAAANLNMTNKQNHIPQKRSFSGHETTSSNFFFLKRININYNKEQMI